MKRKIVMFYAVLLAIAATSFKIVDDIITRLGMQQRSAQMDILNNVVGSFSTSPMDLGEEDNSQSLSMQRKSFQIPYVSTLASIIKGDKAAAAKDLCDYVKKYINSEEFITDYNNRREESMPLTDKGSSLSYLKKNKIMYEKNINNYKTDTKYVAEQQKLMDENQTRIDVLVEESKKPFPGKDKWEKAYPVDPAVLVKKKLQEYLTLVATVDFNATLSAYENKKVFTNPAYEKKSLKWKGIYRAGKEVNDVLTAFVKDWMKGEIIAKEKNKMTEKASTETNLNQNNTSQVKTSDKQTTTNQNNTIKVNSPATNSTDSTATPDKEKKSLFKKLKDKSNSIIKN